MNFNYLFRRITNNSGQLAKYLMLQQDVSALRGQMLWRSKNLGVKELDLIVGSWATKNLKHMNYEQLLKYNQQIIMQQTPDLTKKLLGQLPIQKQEIILNKIREYATNSQESKLEY